MKILFISEFFFEINGASNLSMMHYKTIKDILKEDVIAVALTGGENEKNDEYITYQSHKTKFNKLFNYLQLNNCRINNKIIKEIYKIIEENNVDTVFIDNSTYGKLARHIKRKNKNIKVISFYHDVKRNLAKQWLKKYGIKNLPDYIVTIYNEYLNSIYSDINITLNKRESKLLKKYYKKESDLELPIYINESKNIKEENLNKEEFSILFVGAYYYPNVEGITWFCKNVMPLTNDKCKLYIVGRDMEILRNNLENKKVKVIGTADDLSYYYNLANVVIAPIFEGGGMKVKTAEAFMYGKCFIGSDESLEGYKENIDISLLNKKIFVANSADEYLLAIDTLINNKEKVNFKIREMYKKNYSISSANDKLRNILYELN